MDGSQDETVLDNVLRKSTTLGAASEVTCLQQPDVGCGGGPVGAARQTTGPPELRALSGAIGFRYGGVSGPNDIVHLHQAI